MKQTNKNLHVPAFGYSWFVFTFQSILEKEDKDAKKKYIYLNPSLEHELTITCKQTPKVKQYHMNTT